MRTDQLRLPTTRDPTRIVAGVHRRLARAGLDVPVRLWDGARLGPANTDYELVLRHPGSLRAVLVPPTDLAAGEAYLADDIDVDGSMIAAIRDIARQREAMADTTPSRLLGDSPVAVFGGIGSLVRLGVDVLQLPPPRNARTRTRIRGRAQLAGDTHSLGRDRQAVRHHYDVGNAFYELFLDRRLVYSCGYFTDTDDGRDDELDRAQERKLDLVCRKLHLQTDQSFLDIGCGWGGLIIHAARHYGVRATGITLSEPQAAVAKRRAAEAGVGDRVEVRVVDYREVTGTFDAIASVGMVEHVGAERLADYFATCFQLTAPGGRFLNQGITTGRRNTVSSLADRAGSFAASHVFPDGALVPAHTTIRHLQTAGFRLHDVEQLGAHYAHTCAHWVHRLEAQAETARQLTDEVTYRTWRAYMAGSVVGFESRDLGNIMLLGSRGADLPLGRDWMAPVRPA